MSEDTFELPIEDMLEIVACGGNGSEYVDLPKLMDDAAKELHALRAEVERLKDANAQLQEIVNGDTEEDERIRAENEKLRAALKMARPFIGWAGYYPTILAEVDDALGEKP